MRSRPLIDLTALWRAAALAALALGAALLAAWPPVGSAQTPDAPDRLSGPTRFHTAATIATSAFDQADVAHVVTGRGFPDALAASFAAGSVDGPVLLSARDRIPDPTWDALDELDVETVVLVGGTDVVGEAVDDALTDAGYATDRVSGVNRYQTASSVAMRYGQEQVGTVDGQRTALLASGEQPADALAAGPIAARERLPLLLTPHGRTEASVGHTLDQLDIERILLLGGTEAISEDVEDVYREQHGYDVERIGGPTRMDTASLLADTAVDLGFSHERVLLARGDDYPDALAASVHGAAAGAPIVLSATATDLSAPTRDWLTRTCPDIATVTALGGPAAISDDVHDEAVRAANACEDVAAEDTLVAVTADGRVVVLDPVTGDEIRELMSGVPTDDPATNDISVTPDRSEAYVAVPSEEAGGATEIVRVPTDGGDAEVVATDASSPAVSPDGDTLVYVVHVGEGPGDPDPRLVRRDLTTGEETRLTADDNPYHFISEVSWTADGQRLVFTAGEVITGVHVIDADASRMGEARHLGPGSDSDASWWATAAFDERLAVTETCCGVPPEERWRVLDVDPGDGTVHGTLMGADRVEATHLDSNAEASGLLAVVGGGPDGGVLQRWNGAGEAHTVTDDVVVAAW